MSGATIWLERRRRLCLGCILALGALLRLLVYVDLSAHAFGFHTPALDAEVFLDWALRISRGGDWLGDRPFFLNPLYPYAIAPIVGLAGSHALGAIRIFQALLGLGSVWLAYGSAAPLFGAPVALGAALLAAVNPVAIYYEQVPMIVTLALFTNALALWLLVRFAGTGGVASLFGAGVATGLSMLARPNIALFALVLPVWFYALSKGGRRLRRAAVRTALFGLGVLLVVLPVTFRNWVVGRDWVPVTSSMGLNLWQSNNPEGWRTGQMISRELRSNPLRIETDSILLAEKALGRPLKPSEVSAYWSTRTRAAVRESPGPAAWHLLGKAVYFFDRFELPSSYHYEIDKQQTWLLSRIPADFALLYPLALLGAVAAIRERRGAALFLLLFASYAVGLTVFYPLSHYRAPVLAAVYPLAGLGLGRLIAPVLAREWRRFLGRLMLALACLPLPFSLQIAEAFGVPTVLSLHERQAPYWYNQGVLLVGQNRPSEASEAFERVRRASPGSYLADFGLAALARKQGDRAREGAYLEQALAKHPGDPLLLAYIGRNRFHQGRREEGIRMVEAAREQDPREANIRAILAESYITVGRTAEALRELEAEERYGLLRPQNIEAQVWCLRHLGRLDEARARLERGLRLFPGAPVLTREQRRLDGAPRQGR